MHQTFSDTAIWSGSCLAGEAASTLAALCAGTEDTADVANTAVFARDAARALLVAHKVEANVVCTALSAIDVLYEVEEYRDGVATADCVLFRQHGCPHTR